MRCVITKISELKPHPKNPRIHPDSALNKLVRSVEKWGFTNPIVADKDGIVLAGHARCKSLMRAGVSEAPVLFTDLEGDKALGFLIADNKTQEETLWDDEKLKELVEELQAKDFDVTLTGLEESELEAMFPEENDGDNFNLTEALEKEPFVQEGDIWLLGKHRLMCGDSTSPSDVAQLMDGKKANACITDPPYNIAYEGSDGKTIANDNMGDSEFYQFLLSAFMLIYDNLADSSAFYCFHSDSEKINFLTATENSGFVLHGILQWVKNSLNLSRMDYHPQNEPCIYATKGKETWFGDNKQTDWMPFNKPTKNDIHPTMKPMELISHLLLNSTEENDIVYEPFSGSGSDIIACQKHNRICYAMELDPKYATASILRFNEMFPDVEISYIRNGEVQKWQP